MDSVPVLIFHWNIRVIVLAKLESSELTLCWINAVGSLPMLVTMMVRIDKDLIGRSVPSAAIFGQRKTVVSVQIKPDHGSVRLQCENTFLDGSDFQTDYRKLRQDIVTH